MQLGMIGLGRMGANMVCRLLKAGHRCVVFDMSAKAVEGLVKDPALSAFAGRVSDSGEGRWTIKAAIDEAVPVPVLTMAEDFGVQGRGSFYSRAHRAPRRLGTLRTRSAEATRRSLPESGTSAFGKPTESTGLAPPGRVTGTPTTRRRPYSIPARRSPSSHPSLTARPRASRARISVGRL